MNGILNVFTENLKKIRKSKKLSQKIVAEKSGMIASTYNRIETGKVSPSIDTVEKIALAMEVEVVELFYSSDIKNQSLSSKIKRFENLSEINKKAANLLLDIILEKEGLEQVRKKEIQSRLDELDRMRGKTT